MDTKKGKNIKIATATKQLQQATRFPISPNFVINTATLMTLMDLVNDGCKCGGKFQIAKKKVRLEGHVGCITLVCTICGCERKWESSEKFRDGSYKLNRAVVCAWICVGEEGYDRYSQFMGDWGIGKVNRSTFFATQDKVREEVMQEGERIMDLELKKENEMSENIGTTLKFDTQHSRPQRAGKAADNTTTTFMNGNNKIIHQEHINKEQMNEQGKQGKAQDKATTNVEL